MCQVKQASTAWVLALWNSTLNVPRVRRKLQYPPCWHPKDLYLSPAVLSIISSNNSRNRFAHTLFPPVDQFKQLLTCFSVYLPCLSLLSVFLSPVVCSAVGLHIRHHRESKIESTKSFPILRRISMSLASMCAPLHPPFLITHTFRKEWVFGSKVLMHILLRDSLQSWPLGSNGVPCQGSWRRPRPLFPIPVPWETSTVRMDLPYPCPESQTFYNNLRFEFSPSSMIKTDMRPDWESFT